MACEPRSDTESCGLASAACLVDERTRWDSLPSASESVFWRRAEQSNCQAICESMASQSEAKVAD